LKGYYNADHLSNLRVEHLSGTDLADLYLNADIVAIVRAHHPYLDFAMPVKVFEAIGFGVPMITETGTEAANLIAKEGFGWVLPNIESIQDKLTQLIFNRDEIVEVRRIMYSKRDQHTWIARARTVTDVLNGYSNIGKRN
jgi:spore maturation protein CgeB